MFSFRLRHNNIKKSGAAVLTDFIKVLMTVVIFVSDFDRDSLPFLIEHTSGNAC